ncbi:helix-turn-helix domain-containing protein [uncultured Roseobacter sp.]|uniref:GlxA family transcriptional regulator n=1 Tax=uncultured Roseobacter sp. TaxID=114847 RepID=UPI00261D792E|nr:helix-turn-helix domain-containing protein [uncultured Roseobacter sp.]
MNSAEITRVGVLVLNEANTLSLAAAVDPLRAANRQAGRLLYDWRFLTPGDAPVHLTSGLSIAARPLDLEKTVDFLIVVAGFDLEAQATPLLSAQLRRLAGRAERVAGIDGGPWILAQAGLLNGARATTHWEDLEQFARRFPEVVAGNARFVASGKWLTSGGAAPAIEMMLHVIATDHSPALSARVAGSFIYDAGPAPARPQQRAGLPAGVSAVTARVHALMEAQIEEPLPLPRIARHAGLSLRALQMRFRRELQTTPQAHYLSLRLGEAERLVRDTEMPVQDIALATGFASQAAFARAFAVRFGTSARQLRQGALPAR